MWVSFWILLASTVGVFAGEKPANDAPASISPICNSLMRRLAASGEGASIPDQVLRRLLNTLYNQPKQWIPLSTEADPFVLHTRSTLKIATQDKKFSIPREMANEIEASKQAREARIRKLEAENNLLAEALGDAYRPGYYLDILNALESVRTASFISTGTHYLDPLIQLVYVNSVDFMTSVTKSVLLDEAQGQLLAQVGELIHTGRLDFANGSESAKAAVRSLAVSNFRTFTDPLSDSALEGLRNLVRSGKLNSSESEDLLDDIAQITELGRQLRESRKRYASGFTAARFAYDLLSLAARPDGNSIMETGNVIRRSWISTRERLGDSFPILREIILTYLDGSSRLWHPGLKQSLTIGDGVRNVLQQLPSQEANALLVGQIHTKERMNFEANLGLEWSLEHERDNMRSALREKDLAKIDAKLSSIAQTTVSTAMKSAGPAKITANMMKQVLNVMAEQEAKATGTVDPSTPVGQIVNLPDILPQFINSTTIRMPWLPKAEIKALSPPAAVDPAAAVPVSSPDSVFNHFTRVLQQLDDRAKALFQKDIEAQTEALGERRRISSEHLRQMKNLNRDLLEAVLDLQRALTSCLLQASTGADRAKALLDAEATLAWHLEHMPSLSRFIVNHGNQRALTSLLFRLVLQALKAGANGKAGDLVDPKERDLAKKERGLPSRIRKHKLRIVGLAALIAGSLYLVDEAGLWPSFLNGSDRDVPASVDGPAPKPAPKPPAVDAGVPPVIKDAGSGSGSGSGIGPGSGSGSGSPKTEPKHRFPTDDADDADSK